MQHRIGRVNIGPEQFGLLRILALIMLCFLPGGAVKAAILESDFATHLVVPDKGDERSKAPKIKDLKADDSDAFITVWEVPADDLNIHIPIFSNWMYNYKYDITVEKEGSSNIIKSLSGQTSDLNIPVTEAGRYIVKIRGDFPHFRLVNNNQKDKDKLVAVKQWGTIKWKSFNYAFHNARKLQSVPTTAAPDLSSVTDMSFMFSGASAFNQDLSSWNVSKVTYMRGMFSGATAFNGNLADWNVSKVTNMSFMFSGATAFNGNLADWNVSKVTNMSYMFSGASNFNQNLSGWKVSQVKDMSYMFSNASAFNQDLADWDVSQVEYMHDMFNGATAFNQDLSSWNVSKVKYMSAMLSNSGLSSLNYDKTLVGWAANPNGLVQDVYLGADGLKWCSSAAARDFLKNQKNWNITGDTEDCSDAFITILEVPADDLSIHIPINNAFNYNYDISWEKDGDPSTRQFQSALTGEISIAVPEPGRYIVKIRGDFPHFYFKITNQKDRDKLVAVKQWGTINWTSFAYAFYNARKLQSVPTAAPDLSIVTDMSYMFYGAYRFNGDLSRWDVSKVKNMSYMFYEAYKFNGDLSRWDVSKVKNMSYMFYAASAFNGNLADWDVSQVTNMSAMFYGASDFNQDLSSWDVSKVYEMSFMFSGASVFNGDLSSWNVSQVTRMNAMFSGASDFNQDLSSWDVSQVTDMSFMFSEASYFNQDLSSWDVSKVTTMNAMFQRARSFNQNLASWNVSKVTKMGSMFSEASDFNQDLASWDVSKVNDMNYMFSGATAFNQDLSSWDVSQVTDMSYMFSEASDFNQDLASWNVSKVYEMSFMFSGASVFNGDLTSWNVSQVTMMTAMFYAASDFNQDLSSWDVSQVTDMSYMFFGASAFNQDLSSWDVSKVTTMSSMFRGASDFNQDLSSWDVSQVRYMSDMLSGSGLSSLNYDKTLIGWAANPNGLQPYVSLDAKGLKWCSSAAARYFLKSQKNWNITGDTEDCSDAFITVWEVPANDLNIKIPINNAFNYNYDISWEMDGDQSTRQVQSGLKGGANIPVDRAGRYFVKIRGDFPHFYFDNTNPENRDKLVAVQQWGTIKWKSFAYAFYDARKLQSVPTTAAPDLSSVTDMSHMFFGARAFNGDLASWDVSQVTNMKGMFWDAAVFNGNLADWNVSKVTDMSIMFSGAVAFNGNINHWDVSQVTDMSAMFSSTIAFNQNLADWNVSKVTNMNSMFAFASNFNGNLADWNVSEVTNMHSMFWNATAFNGNLADWNVSEVTNMNSMFWNATAFNGNLADWNVSKVTDMSRMFYLASAFNQDLANWNVSKVTNMSNMFFQAKDFNGDLSSWDVAKVLYMSEMFWNATAFNQDLASWDVSQVKYMSGMLYGSGLSSLNYDKTLIGWAANPNGLQLDVQLGANGLKWCSSAAARDFLKNQKGWRIIGDEQKCIQADANNILYVSKSATGDGTGSSWANALPELADALSWARNQTDAGMGWKATNPLKIYVAVGRYTPLYSAADGKYTVDGQRNNSFVLVKNVQLYGGFDPKNGYDFQGRVQPKASHLLATPQGTILSADLAADDQIVERNGALDFKNYADNAYHVLIASGDVDKALVDGFVIQGGSAEGFGAIVVNGHNVSIGAGAGLSIIKANPQIRNLDIAYNKGNFGGGGLFEYSDANLFNISLNHNHAAYEGGGIYHYESNPTLSNLTITNNTSRLEGAGLRNVDNSSPLILNSILYGNTAENSLTNNVANHNNSSATFQHSLLAGDGSWNPAWGKDGEANDGENIITNLDPFVDRAQGDLSLKRASSAVDAGSMSRLWAALQKADPLNYAGPMPAVTDGRWGLDLAGGPRIVGEQVDRGAYEFYCPTTAPTADALQSFCADNMATIASLIATGEQIKWYSAAHGGTLYPATEVLLDGQTYYASQTKDGCESQSRVAVQVALIPVPDAPVVNAEQQLSYGDTPLALSATASVAGELRWYSAETGGTPSLQALIPVTNVIGEQFFWVSQVNTTTGCESPRSKITVSINKAMPNLGALATLQKTYGDAPFILSPPSSNSPGAFSYSSADTELATVNNSELTIIGAGTTSITVTQAATEYYSEATTSFDLIVDKALISAVSFADASYTYDGTAKSIVLVGSLPQGATVSYSNNSHTDAGTYSATANISGGANYNDQSLTAVLSIDKATISAVSFADASYTYDGTAKSIVLVGSLPQGATVSYSNNSHTDAGTYTATAIILAGANYSDQSLTAVLSIAKKQQVIRFAAMAAVKADAGLISLDISSNSSLPIQLYSENTAVASVVGNGLRVIGAGRTVIRAEQAGDANHLAAVAVSQTLDVSELKEAVVEIRVHQALSPNGDGINDFLRIDGIDKYPENKLVVFDSNGTVIQTIVGYNNHSNYFDGSKGSKPLSKGTYFYTLTVKVDGKSQYDKGFFVIRY